LLQRKRGLAKEASVIELSIMRELGYTGALNDALASNSVMHRVVMGNEHPPSIVGVIPDGAYTIGYGWDDQIITLCDFAASNVPLFSDYARASLKNEEDAKTSKL